MNGYIWSGSGLLLWLIVTIYTVIYHWRKGESYDFGQDASSGQLFIMSIVLGPVLLAISISLIVLVIVLNIKE